MLTVRVHCIPVTINLRRHRYLPFIVNFQVYRFGIDQFDQRFIFGKDPQDLESK
jgi:hypothetical protein